MSMQVAKENIIDKISYSIQSFHQKNILEGFYMIDLQFNGDPYWITFSKKNNTLSFSKKNKGKGFMKGHIFKINNKFYLTDEYGKYHLESPTLFKIKTLRFPYSEDVTITYHIKTTKIDFEPHQEIIYPKNYDIISVLDCQEKILKPSAGENLFTSLSNVKGIEIEASPNTAFTLAGEEIRIGLSEHFKYIGDISTLVYKGYYQDDILITNDNQREVHLFIYTEGGD